MELAPMVCVGHAKCGTTLLDSVFRRSGRVATPTETKELKFFLPRYCGAGATREEYLRNFSTVGGGKEFATTFEASPPYIHQALPVFSEVLDNIDRILDDAIIIVCFRHPLLRAYSHYIHNLHAFGLYGEGVFSARPDLLRKPCRMSFEEALATTTRLDSRYGETLELILGKVGPERVRYFFLERDASDVKGWIDANLGSALGALVPDVPARHERVYERRPVPQYHFDVDGLHAFGTAPGEYMRYPAATAEDARRVSESRARWTLALQSTDIDVLAERYFGSELLRCQAVSGQAYFAQYLAPAQRDELAESTPQEVLCEVHGHAPIP